VGLTVSIDGVAHFAPFCFQGSGVPVSCETLAANLKDLESSVSCTAASDGGCNCQYAKVGPPLAFHGRWARLGNGTIETSDGFEFDFCAAGDQLEISTDLPLDELGTVFFGVSGLHTMSLTKMANPGDGGALPASKSTELPAIAPSVACPSGDACGGDPIGHWQGDMGTVCLDAPPSPFPDPPCENLVYLPPSATSDAGSPHPQGVVVQLDLPHGDGTPYASDIVFSPDHRYGLTLSKLEPHRIHFTPACLTAWGANPSCDDLTHGIAEYYVTYGNVGGVACAAAATGGCDCSYEVRDLRFDGGTWIVRGNELTLSGGNSRFGPTQLAFCRSASQLQMTVAPGSSLADLGPASLTATLTAAAP
jgi:hypothetical protein